MQYLSNVIENIESKKSSMEFLHTGIKAIDDGIDGGFLKKELVILGGHTGGGKSYIAGNFFYNIVQQGFKSAYFSLEISNEMVVSRLMGALSNIKPIRIMCGTLDVEEYKEKKWAENEVMQYDHLMTFYDDLYELEKIEAQIRYHKYEFVVIDFLQNVVFQGQDEYARLSAVSLKLQKLAKETDCCILALSQLSNASARDKNMKSPLEYKGSGSIATVCDLGFIIEHEEIQDNVILGKKTNKVNVILKKNRRGVSGQVFECLFMHPGGLLA